MMMFELFSEAARNALFHATEEAISLGHQELEPEHLVLGIMKEADCIAAIILAEHGVGRRPLADAITDKGTATAEILQTIGIDLQSVRRQAEAAFGPGALDRTSPRSAGLLRSAGFFKSRPRGGAMPYTIEATTALGKSLHEAQALKSTSIGTEHILLGLLADERDPVPFILRRLGADPVALRESLLGSIPHSD